jgi:hypothetical protein
MSFVSTYPSRRLVIIHSIKLFKSGIQGKMWKWIQNFLDERLAKCLVINTEGEWFKTNIGLPQGAVISPQLY